MPISSRQVIGQPARDNDLKHKVNDIVPRTSEAYLPLPALPLFVFKGRMSYLKPYKTCHVSRSVPHLHLRLYIAVPNVQTCPESWIRL